MKKVSLWIWLSLLSANLWAQQATNQPAAPAPAPAAAATNAPATIRFQFEGIPYMDVIERFAQMTAKPLITDTNIQGTLTFNDPKTYNYQEALDTLNLMLAMKGVMLVESGHYLRLVPFKELPAMPLRIMRGTDHSGDVRPGEVVTVVLDVKNLDAKEVADSIASMLSNAGSVAPLSRGRGLIVTDRLGNIQRIRTLLNTIDVAATVDRQMKSYTLLHASGAIISDLLNRTFGVATAPKRTSYNPNTKAMEVLPPDPNDYITSVYDDASRTLVLFGPQERISLAEDLINRFEQKEGPGGDVRIYFPQSIKAEELATIIRQAIPGIAAPGETAASAATKARVIPDNQQNRLIVAAPIPGQLEEIEKLINRVDKNIQGTGAQAAPLRSQSVQLTKVFRPRAADATNVAAILTQALTRRSPGGGNVTTASVSFDGGSQSVVVSGSPGDIQIATDIVTQLETGTTQPTQLQTLFIEVGSVAEAKRLQPLVEQLYRNQVSDGSVGAVAHAKILADTEAGRLIVTANEDHLTKIQTLVTKLRGEKGAQAQTRQLQIIPLKNTRIDSALASIQSMIADRMSDKQFSDLPKPSVIPDAANNRLLVTGTTDQFKQIQEVVNALDIAPARAKREMTVIPVQSKPAQDIITMATQLLSQLGDEPADPQLAPKLMPDGTGKQIIALALAKDVERIRTLIQQLDTAAPASARQFKGVDLFARSAADLTSLVQQLYSEQLKGQPEPLGGPATLIPEVKNNRIMVSGSEKEIQRVEAIIRQLDPEGHKAAKEETRVIRLKSASAAELIGIIEKSLNGQQQQVRVLVDARSNSLVVTGEPAAVDAASQIVQQLDTKSNMAPRELRIIELKSAEAATVSPMLNNLFTEMVKDQRGPDYVSPTKIVPDTTANRIVVTGIKEELDQVSDLVERLDQAPEQAPNARVFKLNTADAVMMAPIVSNAMLRFDSRGLPLRRMTVTADDKSNSLIVSGTRTDLADIASVIEKLDGDTSGRERVLRIFDVQTTDPDALAGLVLKVFAAQNPGRNTASLISITPEPAGKRLIVMAPPAILTQVQTVIESLDAKPDQGARELHALDLKNGNATDLLPKVTQIYSEQSQGKTLKPATIYPDSSGTRLMVYGTKEQAAGIRQILETFETAQRAPRQSKTFELGKLADAQRILPIAQQLYRDQLANQPQSGPPDAQMISDGKTGRIVVSARGDQMQGIEAIFASLQPGGATNGSSRETRTFEAGSASDVQRLLPMVQQLYLEQWRDRIESDPADAQIIPDARAGRFIVTGKPDHVKQIESILQQLGAGKAKTEARDTRIFDLTTANAVELATTVRTLYLEEAKARLGSVSPDTLITADTGGNRLLIVGETNELNYVEEIVKKLDKVSAQSATARVFKLKSADPNKVLEILSSALVRFDALGRQQRRATVSVDAKTRTLIVTGDPKELQGVSAIIEQLDTSLGVQPERKMKVATLKQGRVSEVSPKLRQLYTDQTTAQPELTTTEILIMEDVASNQLILAGTEAQLTLLERILGDLQAARTEQAPRETKFFPIGSADELARVQPLVQQLYTEQWKDKVGLDTADAQILADAKAGRLIVTGKPEHLNAIENIIGRVSASPTNGEPRDTRVYDLNSTSAPELATTVRSLYQEELKARPASLTSQANIFADTTANRLIVSGSSNELNSVESIINKLDKVTAKTGGTRVFQLKNAAAEQVATVLSTALVTINAYGTRVPRVSVGSDPRNNLVVVAGEPKDIQSAGVIIEQMDGIISPEKRQMRILPLKSGIASEVSLRLRQLYQDQVKGQPGSGAADALIMGDDGSNRLILTASESHLSLIEEIVGKLEEAGDGNARQTRVLLLQRNSASAIASMLNQLFARQVASTDPAERLVVTPSDNRTLIIDSTGTTLDRIEDLVKNIDSTPADGPSVIQTVRLAKGSAEALAEAVTRAMTNSHGAALAQRVSVTPVIGANSLIINGPTNDVQNVMKIVRDLDQESSGGEIEVRIYKLENGNAKEVSAVLEQLLQNVSRQGRFSRGRFVPATIAIDERGNSLIISGTSTHFDVAEKILPTLDKAPERSDRDVQFIWLRKAKAYDVVSKVEAIFRTRPENERPVIEADTFNNSLTVIAKRGDIAQIQDLVSRLDDSSKDTSIQVRLRPLDRMAADQMAQMLQNIYPQMSTGRVRVVEKLQPGKTTNAAPSTPEAQAQPPADTNAPPEVVVAIDKHANALILSGPVQELDNIDRIITELSFNFYSNEAEFRLFPLKEADPVIVARTLGDLFRQEQVRVEQQPGQPQRTVTAPPKVTIVPEPRTRSVIIRAKPTDYPLFESIIKQLDTVGQSAQLEFRLVPLTNASPEKVLPLVQQMVTQLNLVRPGEPLTVTVDGRSRSLMVVARDTVLVQVEKMIRSLDTPSAYHEAEVLIIALKKANANQLSVVLQNMLKPGPAGDLPPEARELQEQVRRLKVQNDSGEVVSLDLTRPIKISTDPAAGGTGGGNRLVLTSTPDNLKALAAVVAMMDTPAVIEGVDVRLLALKHADAATVAQTLTSIFSQGRQLATGPSGAGAQPEGNQGKALSNPLNVATDPRSNTLIISGQEDTLDLAEKVVSDLDKQVERFVSEVRLFRLKHASATRLLPLLQSVFTEGPAVPGTEGLSTQVSRLRTRMEGQTNNISEVAKARSALVMQADDVANILIVAARTDTLPLIQDVIQQLDIPAASGLETVRIYPLNHANPAAIQKILTDLFTGPRSTALRNEDKPIISIDDRTSALIIAGNGKSFTILEGLLQQLDQKLPFDLRDIRLIGLEHADANVLAPTIQQLMDARVTQKATRNQGQADILKVIVLADQRSNSLLVGGSKDSFELVETLAKQLDTAQPALSGRIRLIPLEFADSRVLAGTLTTLFEQRASSVKAADANRVKPIILADPRSNSLLVSANQEDNRSIDDLLKRLDAKMENPSLMLTVLSLKFNDAAKIAALLENIFAARSRAQTLPGQAPLPSDQIKLEPDSLNNALIVSASKENVELMQSLLQKIDVEPTIANGVIQTFTLEFADAQRVATILSSLVSQGLYRPGVTTTGASQAKGGRDALAISVDPRSNTLIVSASPENLAVVREILKRVDTKDWADAGNVKMYSLKHARASSLAATFEQFFRAKRTGDSVAVNANERSIPVSVIADDRMNMILVTGGKEAFDIIERMIAQLDGESVFARLNFKVFPLKKATATKVQSTLQAVVGNRPPRVKGEPIEPITIVADPWINAVLVAASVEDMSTVSSLIERLDAEPVDIGISIHFFPLAKADARRVAQTIQGLFREGGSTSGSGAGTVGPTLPVTVTPDERINAVVVSCGEADAKRIGELVKKLDTEQVARVSEIKVFPLQFAKADSLSTILNAALNTKPIPLGEQSPNAQSVLQFITRTEEGRELVTAALKEAILITPDARMNSLIVSGPVDYMGLLEQIIGRLDASSPQQAKIKVFYLQHADARQMAELLMGLFRMTQTATAATANQRSVQYTLVRPRVNEQGLIMDDEEVASATMGTAEQTALTVTIDPRTNSLLVGGTDHYVNLVSQIIESLDSSPANERKSEVVRLKNSQASEVALAIRTFLDQERQRVTTVLGAEAVGTAQRLLEREVAVVAEPGSNTLLVSANPRYFEQIRSLIDELDKPQSQVLIQVVLAEVTLDSLTDLGLEWNYTGSGGNVTYGIGTDFNIKRELTTLGGFSTALTGSDFAFLLRALKEDGRLEVLSRPQIVTADNKPASINIGQRVPLITDSRVTERGDTINSFRYEDVGVNLTVTPKISPDGYVKMEINTTNSAISSASVEINASATVPIINQRRANTTVSAQSGQTILIGGLIDTLDDRRVKKIPYISDIPLLGLLFRSKHSVRDRKELLILLTPQVVSNSLEPGLVKNIQEVTRESLDRSKLRDEFERDALQKQILEPLYPEKKDLKPTAPDPGPKPSDAL